MRHVHNCYSPEDIEAMAPASVKLLRVLRRLEGEDTMVLVWGVTMILLVFALGMFGLI